MFYFLTLYMQNVLGWSPIQTGAGYLPLTSGSSSPPDLLTLMARLGRAR